MKTGAGLVLPGLEIMQFAFQIFPRRRPAAAAISGPFMEDFAGRRRFLPPGRPQGTAAVSARTPPRRAPQRNMSPISSCGIFNRSEISGISIPMSHRRAAAS